MLRSRCGTIARPPLSGYSMVPGETPGRAAAGRNPRTGTRVELSASSRLLISHRSPVVPRHTTVRVQAIDRGSRARLRRTPAGTGRSEAVFRVGSNRRRASFYAGRIILAAGHRHRSIPHGIDQHDVIGTTQHRLRFQNGVGDRPMLHIVATAQEWKFPSLPKADTLQPRFGCPSQAWPESMSHTLRAAILAALVFVLAVVWVVYRTAERAQDSNQWVVHTQEVLKAIESVLSTLVDTESTVSSYLASAGDRGPDPLDQAERIFNTDIRLATLTVDHPDQQARVQQLRQEGGRTLGALRAQWDAKGGPRAANPVDAGKSTNQYGCGSVDYADDAHRREPSAGGPGTGGSDRRPPASATYVRSRAGRRRTPWMDWLARHARHPTSAPGHRCAPPREE